MIVSFMYRFQRNQRVSTFDNSEEDEEEKVFGPGEGLL